ncbi:DUF6406 domain-containing protein [Streptomyces sp. NPDC050121]|uniref:DUF6406 domain-containing protein n=1 Tax=Streptomyces sp. NPDC050121 TaxID=3365601 RepID=UPI0037B9E73F
MVQQVGEGLLGGVQDDVRGVGAEDVPGQALGAGGQGSPSPLRDSPEPEPMYWWRYWSDGKVSEVRLVHGVPVFDDGIQFGVIYVYAPPEGPLTVRLGVAAGGERRYTLEVGDSFLVRAETWKVDRVENPGSNDWCVVLKKVDSDFLLG